MSPLVLPPGKEVAVMHMHTVAPTQDAGSKFITEMKEAPLLKSIAPALRRLIINFRSAQDFIGDIEVLEGHVRHVALQRAANRRYPVSAGEDLDIAAPSLANVARPDIGATR